MTIATWTPERVEQLRTFVVTGLSCSQIAAEIGVSRNAVIGKIHRLGLAPGRPAGTPVRACPPRARRPRFSPQRIFPRLMFAGVASPANVGLAKGGAPWIAHSPVESARPCSLLELAQGKCRWPVGDRVTGAAEFAFCANDVIAGFSYCAAHTRMAYRLSARPRA
ncbi:MAG TPA: GcrA family cell cycle regulator [Xanthobacteraceae bacterium]|jgi:GcrA cell cycle regulator